MRRKLVVLLLLTMAGCASERVVLLPSKEGKPSAVLVRNEQGMQLLDSPYAESVRRSGHRRVKQSNLELVQQRYAASLAAQPPRGRSFMLFFETSSDVPLQESMLQFDLLKSEIASRPAAEIVVIGHTDRVGSVEENDALSARRVESVRALLLASGFSDMDIDTAFRGEREPLVLTPDGVSDPLNRRVEISVR